MSYPEVDFSVCGDIKLIYPVGDLVSENIVSGAGWDNHLRKIIDFASANGGVAIDAGAHIGYQTILMAKKFAKVISFEPQDLLYYCLCGNIALNSLTNVTPFKNALLDKNCHMMLARPEWQDVAIPSSNGIIEYRQFNNYGAVAFEYAESISEGVVQATNLDSLIIEKIAFIKIDCQGSDLLVLKGASNIIIKDRPIIAFESEKKMEASRGILRDEYFRFFYDVDYDLIVTRNHENGKQVDFVALPRSITSDLKRDFQEVDQNI